MNFQYKEKCPLKKRRAEGDKIRWKYPDRLPAGCSFFLKSTCYGVLTISVT